MYRLQICSVYYLNCIFIIAEEVERLQEKLLVLTNQAGEKTKTELLKARDERNNTIKKLSQELAAQQMVIIN